MTHQHTFTRFADFHHAPAAEPPAHTHIIVMTCSCGVWDVFPLPNFDLATAAFRVKLTVFLRSLGFARLDIAEHARQLAAEGGTHECSEWRSMEGTCLLCDRRLPPEVQP